jgi:hypothetical protein
LLFAIWLDYEMTFWDKLVVLFRHESQCLTLLASTKFLSVLFRQKAREVSQTPARSNPPAVNLTILQKPQSNKTQYESQCQQGSMILEKRNVVTPVAWTSKPQLIQVSGAASATPFPGLDEQR